MLFSVIGAALDFGKLPLETIPLSIAVIVTGKYFWGQDAATFSCQGVMGPI